jgi:hypothetical protein
MNDENLTNYQRQADYPDVPSDVPLSRKPTCVRLPEVVAQKLAEMSAGERSAWLRVVITDAAIKKLGVKL